MVRTYSLILKVTFIQKLFWLNSEAWKYCGVRKDKDDENEVGGG